MRLLEDNGRQRAELEAAGHEADDLNRRLAELVERRTVELRQAREDLALVDGEFRQRYTEIVGRGVAMTALLRQVDRVADTNVPVLFEGESGTGKELLAHHLHDSSARQDKPFVPVDCASIPAELAASMRQQALAR